MEEKYFIYMAKKGDYDSFKILYDKYYMKVYNYVYGKMKNKSDVEDIIQVAFLKVYKNLKFYDNKKGNFYNFILTNCKQVISDFYTKKMTRESIAEEVGFDGKVVNDVLIDNSDIGNDNYNITSAIQKLTEEQKEAFILIYIKHIKQKEAAQIMGKSVGSVKSLAFRARQVLKEEIAKNNPELGKRYGFTKYLKIAIILTVGFALIGGFTYAMFRLYKANVKKNTFTLADVERELPEEEAKISREEAIEIMQNDLEILGMNTEFDETKLHLKRDYMTLKDEWAYSDVNTNLIIDSKNGKIILYACLNDEISPSEKNYEDSINKLSLIEGYELYNREYYGKEVYIEYAKKYGDIFNLYQKVSIIVKNERIISIAIVETEYEDTELKINKEEAIKILNNNNIDYNNIELTIEDIQENKIKNNYDVKDIVEELEKKELKPNGIKAKKVWKIEDSNNNIWYIDVYSGQLILKSNMEQKSN